MLPDNEEVAIVTDGYSLFSPTPWFKPALDYALSGGGGGESGENSQNKKKPKDIYVARCRLHHDLPGRDMATLVRQAASMNDSKGISLIELNHFCETFDRDEEYLNRYPNELEMIISALQQEAQIKIDGGKIYPTQVLRLE